MGEEELGHLRTVEKVARLEGSVERSAGEVRRARFDYTFDGAIRGKVRVSLDTEPNDCFDLGT